MKRFFLALLVFLAAVLVALFLWGRSQALDAGAVERSLLAVPSFAEFDSIGLSRHAFDVQLDGEIVHAELTWCHVPRAPGSPQTQPIVLVHGTPDTLFAWRNVMFGGGEFRGLAGGAHDVYAIEVLGHGSTVTEAPPCTFERCAEWVAAAVRSLGLKDVCLVGQSYGGEFVWRAALDHPDLIERVVLIDSSGLARPDDGWLSEEVQMRENPLAEFGWLLNSRERVRSALDLHFDGGAPGAVVDTFVICCSRPANWAAMVDLVRDENGARAGELGQLVQPTLILWGDDDIAYPPDDYGRRLAEAIPNARLTRIAGAGHYPHIERAPAVVVAIRDFVGAR